MATSRATRRGALAAVAVLAGLTGCASGDGGSTSSVDTPPAESSADTVYAPSIDPSTYVDVIDNPYFPLAVGSTWRYEGTDDEGAAEVVEITVLDETRPVMGVTTHVVRDRVTVDSEVVEDTFDWYAQDADGNVWYFGEEVKDYEDGQVVSTAGSWEAGIDGALPGIVMPASPHPGQTLRQEYYEGEAEDMFDLLALDASIDTPAGTFSDALLTRDWTPLEPGIAEEKLYVAGIGKVAERKVEGGSGGVALVSYHLGG
jgi:hypothetical protein